MQTFQVFPLTGQKPAVGYGTVMVIGPNVPNLVPGDVLTIIMYGQNPGPLYVGGALPGETTDTFYGVMQPNGAMTVEALPVKVAGSLLTAPMIISTGVFPQDGNLEHVPQPGVFMMAPQTCQYGPAAPPPAVLPPSLDGAVADIVASWQPPHVAVADWRTDSDKGVTYMTSPPTASAPYATTVPNGECLSMVAAARVAAAFGGTVEMHPPRVWADVYSYVPGFPLGSVQPNVTWIAHPNLLGDGVARRAQGSELVEAFDTRQTGMLRQNIINTFQVA